jgi:lysozyme
MINKAGEQLTKSFESLRLKAYKDSAGVWSIGWGHASDNYFPVLPGSVITEDKAEELFVHYIGNAEATLKHQLPNLTTGQACLPDRQAGWQNLNENQYAACVDFVYNRGTLKWHSGAETKLHELLLAGQYDRVPDEFLTFTKDIEGHVLEGLLRRRTAEKNLFIQPCIIPLPGSLSRFDRESIGVS